MNEIYKEHDFTTIIDYIKYLEFVNRFMIDVFKDYTDLDMLSIIIDINKTWEDK